MLSDNAGTTDTERYLARLCRRTFLSLWSYPNVHREKAVGRNRLCAEVCDLLVSFEDRILIFSDKGAAVHQDGDVTLRWQRWFRAAVKEGARQARGAEHWIRQNQQRIFRDNACKHLIPGLPPITASTHVHLIVTTHEVADLCRGATGGARESLTIKFALKGEDAHSEPCTIGDINPSGSFIHVLDDRSLEVLMTELDTISDFVTYLDHREHLVRSGLDFLAEGEEELLAWYLSGVDDSGQHAFVFPEHGHPIGVGAGGYSSYLASPARHAKQRADEVSYLWDGLIEKLTRDIREGALRLPLPGSQESERLLRLMARESRLRRRLLARTLARVVTEPTTAGRRIMVVAKNSRRDPYYLFLLLARESGEDHDCYRQRRQEYLKGAARVVRLMRPDADDVIGVSTEAGNDPQTRAHDVIHGDFRLWNAKEELAARQFQEQTGVLIDGATTFQEEPEYPETASE